MKRPLIVALASTLLLGASVGTAWAQVGANDRPEIAEQCDADDELDSSDNSDVLCDEQGEDTDADTDEDGTAETANGQQVNEQHGNNVGHDADEDEDDDDGGDD